MASASATGAIVSGCSGSPGRQAAADTMGKLEQEWQQQEKQQLPGAKGSEFARAREGYQADG